MARRVVLTVEEGVSPGARFELAARDVFIFGRDAACDARLGHDPYASRHHFLIESGAGRLVLRDLGSTNGTAVNGRRLRSRGCGTGVAQVDLADGDRVRAGRTTLRVQVEDVRDAPPPVVVAPSPDSECIASIGGFDVESEVGRGASGVTFRARRRTDGMIAAVKVVFAAAHAGEEVRRRFLREMDVLRSLRHPNIVSLIEAGDDGRHLYIAMEYCDRGAASRILDAHPGGAPLDQLRTIFVGAARGLAHAHARGLVHRDLKPDNLLLSAAADGVTARLGDFGLAKGFEDAGISGLTLSGAAAGTLSYMPREQLLDFKHVRPASDVWALGATFYHLLCGTPPRCEDRGDPLQVVLEGEVVPMWKRRSDVPDRLRLVVERSLAAAPEDRYPDGKAMLDALARAL